MAVVRKGGVPKLQDMAMIRMPGFDQALRDVGILPPPTFGGQQLFSQEEVAEAAFAHYRQAYGDDGFPYRKLPLHLCMQELNRLANTETGKLIHTVTGYHVADTYHPHRFHAAAKGMKAPYDSFHSDKSLLRAINMEIEKGGSVGDGILPSMLLVLGTQACANFRPGFACYLYRKYCQPGARVLDTSTGYGGRLVGFMASGIAGHYVGIDPNTPTYQGNLKMASDLGFADKVTLLHSPAEDVAVEQVGEASCDFAFTSPPYFAKERYSTEDTQSWVRYGDDKTGEAWRQGFLAPMMRLQFAALKPSCFALVNIADVKLFGREYPLKDWCIEAARSAGFTYRATEVFPMAQRVGANQDEGVAEEPLLIFEKV